MEFEITNLVNFETDIMYHPSKKQLNNFLKFLPTREFKIHFFTFKFQTNVPKMYENFHFGQKSVYVFSFQKLFILCSPRCCRNCRFLGAILALGGKWSLTSPFENYFRGFHFLQALSIFISKFGDIVHSRPCLFVGVIS